jgi:spore coat polysaccharide biosynthesis predicted glycosyltransferase SpsG
MLALCVESSHARGMGHLFRSCVLGRAFIDAGQAVKFYVNDHPPTVEVLRQRGFSFEIVPLSAPSLDWETAIVDRDGITLWINDRHQTDRQSTGRVKAKGVVLVTLDDRGSGAADADLHVAALALDPQEMLGGRKVLRGLDYLLLDPAIARHRRSRSSAERYVMTLGGADTHGVTPKLVRLLIRLGRCATVILGPAFQHEGELAAAATPGFEIKRNVPSLIEEFSRHDVAVTGGGMTPFEANASGLPCIVVANEDFEVPVGRALAKLGGAVFAGHHSDLDESAFARDLPVEVMSKAALDGIKLDGARRVVEAVLAL